MVMKKIKIYLLAALIIGISAASALLTVYADTDGNELRITAQPDKLILQLGTDWAGTEFELKLDYGVFPVPVTTNNSGVLTIELGGSRTYTLTRLRSEVPPQVPEIAAECDLPAVIEENEPVIPAEPPSNEIPVLQLALFLSGLILAVACLLIMRAMKKRREYNDDSEYEYDDE